MPLIFSSAASQPQVIRALSSAHVTLQARTIPESKHSDLFTSLVHPVSGRLIHHLSCLGGRRFRSSHMRVPSKARLPLPRPRRRTRTPQAPPFLHSRMVVMLGSPVGVGSWERVSIAMSCNSQTSCFQMPAGGFPCFSCEASHPPGTSSSAAHRSASASPPSWSLEGRPVSRSRRWRPTSAQPS